MVEGFKSDESVVVFWNADESFPGWFFNPSRQKKFSLHFEAVDHARKVLSNLWDCGEVRRLSDMYCFYKWGTDLA